MKILVINCGSSSIKYKLYEMDDKSVLAAGGIEKIGLEGAFLKAKLPDGTSKVVMADVPTHTEGIKLMFDALLDKEYGAISSLDEISAAGHRIVHGGVFTKSLVVTVPSTRGPTMLKTTDPTANRQARRTASYHIRRYGAHGTSHRYVTGRVAEFLGVDAADKRIITCHIGNGASMSAVDHGRCVDTSMGLTPLEGLMMGTRTGDIDSSAILYIMKKEGQTPDEASDLLNKESGLKGFTGISSDLREIEQAIREGNDRAKLGMEMYEYRIKKYIGAYAAAMGGVDIIVFTAGVGEHQWDVRAGALEGLDFLGIKLDAEKNKKNFGEEEVISAPDSAVTVAVIPTDEELLIASDTLALVTK